MIKSDGELLSIAEKLTQEPVLELKMALKGGNNRLFKITTPSQHYALKFHLHLSGDPRDRQGVETQALTFLQAHGSIQTPKLYGVDRVNRCSLMEWIDGEPIATPSHKEIGAALQLVATLHRLGQAPEARNLPLASAASLSGRAVERQLENRLAQLQPSLAEHPSLADFIRADFTPFLQQAIQHAQENYQKANQDFDADIGDEKRLLSPSDFGFHNALRHRDGHLVFLDFEYFGWDDPCKMCCDFLLHSGMDIATEQKKAFTLGVVDILQSDTNLSFRITQLYPLFGLCWCLIILNEFIPQRWQRRVLAAGETLDRQRILTQQLAKAQQLLDSLQREPLGWIS
ncbi:MAG: aminoglycoside phosphotransferase family protein [Magnetococcales bacterium]|nr:aminoglycoside phosphotransferase family protein [Magnetococcales bacterium]